MHISERSIVPPISLELMILAMNLIPTAAANTMVPRRKGNFKDRKTVAESKLYSKHTNDSSYYGYFSCTLAVVAAWKQSTPSTRYR